MIITGKTVKFGDNINTDVILPGKYMVILKPEELALHAMEGLDPNFIKKAKNGIIIVAGRNFGCGSSREQAPLALKHAGVKCILAESFARIFYRNAINIGLPVGESKEILNNVEENDNLTVNFNEGEIKNNTQNKSFKVTKFSPFIMEIISDGGLINNLKKRIETK